MRWMLIVAAPLCCMPALALAAPAPLRSQGEAYARAGGGLLYREVHWQQAEGQAEARMVLYLCPDGRPFARKWMPATTLAQTPAFDFEDRRSGQAGSVRLAGADVEVVWQEDRTATPRRQRLPLAPAAVIDAGFDAGIRAAWAPLMSGAPVAMNFLMPGRQRWVPVRVQRSAATRWHDQPAEVLRVSVDAWYGFAAPSLSLVYASADRRLLAFRGTSNVRDASGRYPAVEIRFAQPPVPATASAWRADRERPLVADCAAPPAGQDKAPGITSARGAASDRAFTP